MVIWKSIFSSDSKMFSQNRNKSPWKLTDALLFSVLKQWELRGRDQTHLLPGLPEEPRRHLQYAAAHIQFKLHYVTKSPACPKRHENKKLTATPPGGPGGPRGIATLCHFPASKSQEWFSNTCTHVRHPFLRSGQEIKSCSIGFTRHLCSVFRTFRKWGLEDLHSFNSPLYTSA